MSFYKWKKIYTKIFFNEELTRNERELFVSLILICDTHGIYYAEPSIIKSNCYKYIDITEDEIWETMRSLEKKNFITIYENNGKNFYILNYLKYNPAYYQSKSEFPEPPKEIKKKEVVEFIKQSLIPYDTQKQLINELVDNYPTSHKYQKEIAKEVLKKKLKTMDDYKECKQALEDYINFIDFLRSKFTFATYHDQVFSLTITKIQNSFEK